MRDIPIIVRPKRGFVRDVRAIIVKTIRATLKDSDNVKADYDKFLSKDAATMQRLYDAAVAGVKNYKVQEWCEDFVKKIIITAAKSLRSEVNMGIKKAKAKQIEEKNRDIAVCDQVMKVCEKNMGDDQREYANLLAERVRLEKEIGEKKRN